MLHTNYPKFSSYTWIISQLLWSRKLRAAGLGKSGSEYLRRLLGNHSLESDLLTGALLSSSIVQLLSGLHLSLVVDQRLVITPRPSPEVGWGVSRCGCCWSPQAEQSHREHAARMKSPCLYNPISEITYHRFGGALLVIQANPDKRWKRSTQVCGNQGWGSAGTILGAAYHRYILTKS